MAKWQTEIYRGKPAETVKSEYRKLLAVGKSEEDAQRIIVEACMGEIDSGSVEEGRMWLALALRQWELGRLNSTVKNQALRWADLPSIGLSQDALHKLKLTLSSEMPAKKRIPLPSWVSRCPWPEGGLLAYRIISSDSERVRNSPYWKKYVLLRIVKINRSPVTWLAPEAACNESMLVGLYNWWGNTIPEPCLVESLDFTPIAVLTPNLPESVRTASNCAVPNTEKIMAQLQRSLFSCRIETCCALDWRVVKGLDRNAVFTYLGSDPNYRVEKPDYFKTGITEYAFAHSIPFDVMLVNRLSQLADHG